MTKTQANVRWATDGVWLLLRTPYNAAFVNELKDRIRYIDRVWDPVRRVWKVKDTAEYRTMVGAMVLVHYDVDLGEPEQMGEASFTSPGGAGTGRSGGDGPSVDAREIATLKAQLAEARRENMHLNMVIRSLNVDIARLRRMSGGGDGGGGLLEKVLRTKHGQKAYNKLATVLHPDVGGDLELFKELEQAWSKVKP
jgi:hypothetical protein